MAWDKNGLLNPADQTYSENCSLFTLEYILLGRELQKQSKFLNLPEIQELFKVESDLLKALEGSKRPGYYVAFPQAETHLAPGDIMCSHDNLTAFSCVSVLLEKGTHAADIWSIIKQGWGTRPAFDEQMERTRVPIHPRDIIYWGILNKRTFMYLLFPLFVIFAMVSFLGDDTSGKLLYFVRCKTLSKHFLFAALFKLLSFQLKIKGWTWLTVFRIYFGTNHPNTTLASKLWS